MLSAVEARSLLYSIQCNAHRIVSHKSGEKAAALGLGLFPLTSMMNHSCSPNAVHCFLIEAGRPPRLIMRAIDIIDIGDELCYSYVNLYQSTATRRSQLSAAYSFHCICPRCTAGEVENATESNVKDNNMPQSEGGQKGYCSDRDIDMLLDVSIEEKSKFEEIENFITSCTSMASSNGEGEQEKVIEALNQLSEFLDGCRVLMFHPAHRLLFLCYHSFSLTAINIALNHGNDCSDNNHTTISALKRAIGFGLLALGCMRKYVTKVQSEIGHLEGRLALGVELLLKKLKISDDSDRVIECSDIVLDSLSISGRDVQDNTHKIVEIVSGRLVHTESSAQSTSSSTLQSVNADHFPNLLTDVLISQNYLNSYLWVQNKDPRVLDLLDSACLIELEHLDQSDSGISSSSSSSSRERNVLTNLQSYLEKSSRDIEYICRAEE